MGGASIWHWLVVGIIVLVLFGGRGKISELMGDFAKGLKSFKKGMQDEDDTAAKPPVNEPVRTLDHQPPAPATAKVEPGVQQKV